MDKTKKSQSFKDLIVWKKSIELSLKMYEITKKLPIEEKFGLVSQMRRCSISVPSNIAEGSKRGSKKDFIQFLRIANGSAAELETQMIIAKRLYPNLELDESLNNLLEIQKMLFMFIKKIQ